MSWLKAAFAAVGLVLLCMAEVAPSGAQQTAGPAEMALGAAADGPLPLGASRSALSSPIKKFRGRLPAYFAKVVDDQQRRAIYEIQEVYHQRIEALKAQLAALTAERDVKIESVLSEPQRLEVEQMRAAARAKRNGTAEISATN